MIKLLIENDINKNATKVQKNILEYTFSLNELTQKILNGENILHY